LTTCAGAILLLIGVSGLALLILAVSADVDWNRYKPLSWLINESRSSDSVIASAARMEIDRRMTANLLSDAQINQLVERALADQQAGKIPRVGSNPLDLVGQRFLDGKLSQDQTDRFFANGFKVTLTRRATVGTLDPVPYAVSNAGQGPGNWWLRVRTLETQVDDEPPDTKISGSTSGSFSGWTTYGMLLPLKRPGKHRLRVRVELSTDRGSSAVTDDQLPVARRQQQDLVAEFQVIEGHTPVSPVSDPNPDALKSRLKVHLSLSSSSWLNVQVDGDRLPVDTAFDVFVRSAGVERRVAAVNMRSGIYSSYSTGANDVPQPLPASIDVILRGNASIARSTVDMTTFWQNEVTFTNVPIRIPVGMMPATAATTAPTSR
jgi:hypothetical protein